MCDANRKRHYAENWDPYIAIFTNIRETVHTIRQCVGCNMDEYLVYTLAEFMAKTPEFILLPVATDLQLIWIDLPRRQFNIPDSYATHLNKVFDFSDKYKIPLVITGTRFRSQRFGRRRDYKLLLERGLRTVHCTCKYGMKIHEKFELCTHYVDVENATCSMKGHELDPVDTPERREAWATIVRTFVERHVSCWFPDKFGNEVDLVGTADDILLGYQAKYTGFGMMPDCGLKPVDSFEVGGKLAGQLTASLDPQLRPQQLPDSPVLRTGTTLTNQPVLWTGTNPPNGTPPGLDGISFNDRHSLTHNDEKSYLQAIHQLIGTHLQMRDTVCAYPT